MADKEAEDQRFMRRALQLALKGQGAVEPNPMVGCVIVDNGEIIGEGWHARFGGPHAEVEALQACRRSPAAATLYVTLEPCCHVGKTPPCTEAIIAAGIRRVVVALPDPFPQVAGEGIQQLRQAGIRVQTGVAREEAAQLNAPYLKLVQRAQPWVIAKWAMTLDGRIATRRGDSRWISSPASRQLVHRLRGNMDAIIVGRATAETDDPQLTARPAGARTALRVVLDSRAQLPTHLQIVQTATQTPTLIACGPRAGRDQRRRLEDAGCQVVVCPGKNPIARWRDLLAELGRRRFTNVLVEGGGRVLGSCFDGKLVDEVHVFIAPKIVGGRQAPTPIAGKGVKLLAQAFQLPAVHHESIGGDLHIWGRIRVPEKIEIQ